VAVDQSAAAFAVAVTADAMAAMATESTYLTFWFASLMSARLTGSIARRLIDSSVMRASWPHFTVLAIDADPVAGETSGYSEPGPTARGFSPRRSTRRSRR
jgi:hypothetical protein